MSDQSVLHVFGFYNYITQTYACTRTNNEMSIHFTSCSCLCVVFILLPKPSPHSCNAKLLFYQNDIPNIFRNYSQRQRNYLLTITLDGIGFVICIHLTWAKKKYFQFIIFRGLRQQCVDKRTGKMIKTQ